jgi:hypothetical protein
MAKTITTYNVYISVVEGSKDNVLIHSGHNKAAATKAYNEALKRLNDLNSWHKEDDEWQFLTRYDQYSITDFSNCWRIMFDATIEHLDEDGEIDETLTELKEIAHSHVFFTHNIENF